MSRLVAVLAMVLLAASLRPVEGMAQITVQEGVPDLWLVAHADTVLVLLPGTPEPHHGFVVYRGRAGGPEERITQDPVVPVRRPGLAMGLLGEQTGELMDLLRVDSEVQLLRRLSVDEFQARTLSLLYRGVARTLGRFHADAAVEPGATYDYRVVFIDEDGEETQEARSATVTVDDVMPSPPTGLSAEAENLRVLLTWSFPAYQGDPLDLVTGFQVYRSEDGRPFQRITRAPVVRVEGTPLEYLDRDVRNGVEYRYTLRSVDMAGRLSAPLDPVSAVPVDPRPPSPAEGLVTQVEDGRVRLAWRMAPEADVAGYRLERSLGLSQPYEPVLDGLVPTEEPLYTDSTVVGGTRYFYRVTVVDSAGRESQPGTPVVAVPFDDTPPEAPGTPRVTVEDRRAQVGWTASPSDDVAGYHLYRGENPDRLVRVNAEIVADTSFLDTGFEGDGLSPGEDYLVRVTAVDRSGNESPPSEVAVAVPDDEAPEPATAVRAENERGRHVELRWNASPSRDVARYLVSRASDAEAEPTPLDSLAAGVGPFSLRDTAVARGTTYRYRVVAVDSVGNRSGADEVSVAVRDFQPPPPPRFAEASRTEEGISLRWERVVAPDLVGYRVYRATSPTGVVEAVSELLPPDAPRTFVDADGTVDHYYTVRAVDRSGNESEGGPVVSAPGIDR